MLTIQVRHAASTCSAESAFDRSGPPLVFVIMSAGIALQTSSVFDAPVIIAVGCSLAVAGRQIIVACAPIALGAVIASWPPMASAIAAAGIASTAHAAIAEITWFFIRKS